MSAQHTLAAKRAPFLAARVLLVLLVAPALGQPDTSAGGRSGEAARAWTGTITIPTYPWESDINPKFWALDTTAQGPAVGLSSIIYPYTMQDHLFRVREDRTYKALFLENEYLKATCLPALGGRLHSVLDKTTGQEMFHANRVIKPSMIAMRGAWISGGVEWNAGPQGHTVTSVAPVDVLAGEDPDGSAWLEIANLEQSQRTRWTVRLTLHPGRAYLDERIRLFNPADAVSPYYFWNCTAFPCRAGTRFVFPMTLGTDHSAEKFFTWPVFQGCDLTWLKNYEDMTSIFARDCVFDFFGAYDVDADRGVVQTADHRVLPGKKAWTWGTSDFGLVAQQNLTDEDGPYIEVQSGPLPTQSDYGMLAPRQEVAWQEWWYPVHGLGDGFEFATRDVALQTYRHAERFELRVIATAVFPQARCTLASDGRTLLETRVDLSPDKPQVVEIRKLGSADPVTPIEVTITAADGALLAGYTSPLAIPQVSPPASQPADVPDAQRTAADWCARGRKADLATNRRHARHCDDQALQRDPACGPALRGLGVLDFEAADYARAAARLERAAACEPTDGLAWYFLGASRLALGDRSAAPRCAEQTARCPGAAGLGHDLAGRAWMRAGEAAKAVAAFTLAVQAAPHDARAADHLLLARYAVGDEAAWNDARARLQAAPTEFIPHVLLALTDDAALAKFATDIREYAGEPDFELLDAGLALADLGLYAEAERIVAAGCVAGRRPEESAALPRYHLAYWAAQRRDAAAAARHLASARTVYRDREFPAHPESRAVLEYAVAEAPDDAHAHLHLGNLLAHLGHIGVAVAHWRRAAELTPALSVAWRNLGLHSRLVDRNLEQAADYYRRAIAARPNDQTLSRDLAEILIATGQRPEAIALLEKLPEDPPRRADVIVLLAQAYLDEQRYDDVLAFLDATPHFVAWEGQMTTWTNFSRAHLERGRARLAHGEAEAALRDFSAAVSYPANLGVGRPSRPEHAAALYGRGQALAQLGRTEEARRAWTAGAAGAPGSGEQNRHIELCRAALAGE